MRITGLATGLDVDDIVKQTMKGHRIKIDQAQQKKDLVEIRQKLYRDVIADSRKFYDKYFDLAKGNNIFQGSAFNTVKYISSNESIVSAKETSSGFEGKYTVDVKKMATSANMTLNKSEFEGKNTIRIEYGDVVKDIDIDGLSTEAEIAKKINNELSSVGVKAYYSEFAKGIVLESKETGTSVDKPNKFKVTIGNVDSSLPPAGEGENNPLLNAKVIESSEGENAEVTITDSKGRVVEYVGDTSLNKNSVTIDGIEFSFHSVGTATITGKKDVTEVKNKLIEFFNDYNTLVEKLNVLMSEKKDRGYMPLTAEQKKEMSEEEIKLWDSKVKQGQLGRDMHLTSMLNSMKNSMSNAVAGAGITLESIGISPVKDYQSKAGTFVIDEAKLTKALEENMDSIKTLFINTPSTTGEEGTVDKYNEKGIFTRLKDIIYDTCISTKSPLLAKVGYEGTSTYATNELTRSMQSYQKKIDSMEKDFARREQALYSQYARLETAMNKYNSQLGSLSQMTGGGM